MGQRGPAPAPTALKLLTGARASRVNQNEPQPLDEPLDKPEFLSDTAAAEWDRILPHLTHMKTGRAVDLAALAAYCETWSRWLILRRLTLGTPPSFKRTRKNDQDEDEVYFVKNPLWSQFRDINAELRVWAREFGFTPSARSGLRVEVVNSDVAGRLLNHG